MIKGEAIIKPINSISIQENLIKDSSLNSNIEFLLNEIKIVNSSINEVGISISKIAKSLYEIKKLIKNNCWVKFTASGIFNLNGRICRDLGSAHEKWLFITKIPEHIFAEVSPRTLAKIGNVDLKIRNNIIKILKEVNSLTEAKSNEIIAPKKDLQFNFNHKIKKAIEIYYSLTNAEKIKQFKTIMVINIKQKEEIINLKNTISKLKSIKNISLKKLSFYSRLKIITIL